MEEVSEWAGKNIQRKYLQQQQRQQKRAATMAQFSNDCYGLD